MISRRTFIQGLLPRLSHIHYRGHSCSTERYGTGVDGSAGTVQVKDLILRDSYRGKVVTLQGIITSQCGTNGCWFFRNDGSGQVYINLAPQGMVLPPRTGKRAKVTGVVDTGPDGLQIIARGIEDG